MQELAEQIFEILKDYHCDYPDTKHKMSVEHILKWAGQFGDDAEFILTELLHFLSNVYVSREKAISILKKQFEFLKGKYRYSSMDEFIKNTYFIDVQKEEKSQKEILVLVKEILQKDYKIDYDSLQQTPSKKHYIYFDDILATGGTIFKNLKSIFYSNLSDFEKKEKTINICLFCCHTLGYNKTLWRLKYEYSDSVFKVLSNNLCYYLVENRMDSSQKLNCAYPIDKQSNKVLEYIGQLNVNNPNSPPTFRPEHLPLEETFFSSKENRNKFEKIILDKGLELLQNIKKENPDSYKRPLGHTVKSHKTLGTGTLFFTWRNISNTCPIVFWWDAGHYWTPLFSLKNRGEYE
ncbi:MAG: hypothetical protein Q3983_00880 [Capnocytophaga sp.]|nr:hypothetical protein [Capnocytophaga sp.]